MKSGQLIIALFVAALFVVGSVVFLNRTAPEQKAVVNQEPFTLPVIRKPVSILWYEGARGYDKAQAEYKETKAPAVIYFYTNWCGYCKEFERELLSSAPVKEYFNDVVKLRINPDDSEASRKLTNQYGVKSFPTFLMLPPQTNTPVKVERYKKTAEGWVLMSPEEFVQECQRMAGSRG